MENADDTPAPAPTTAPVATDAPQQELTAAVTQAEGDLDKAVDGAAKAAEKVIDTKIAEAAADPSPVVDMEALALRVAQQLVPVVEAAVKAEIAKLGGDLPDRLKSLETKLKHWL